MSELIELLRPILWVIIVFGILFGSAILGVIIFFFVKIIKSFKDDEFKSRV